MHTAHTAHDKLGPSATDHTFILDTSSTRHFLAPMAPHTNNKTPTNNGIQVRLPNQETMVATPHLPKAAHTAHIFPNLGNSSLILVGQLCDANCTATFTAYHVTIKHNGKTILYGTRTNNNNLWTATMQPVNNTSNNALQPQVNNLNHTHKAAKLLAFAHGTLFSPAITTLQQALCKNYIHNFPGITKKTLHQHLPHSIATIKGHLDQS